MPSPDPGSVPHKKIELEDEDPRPESMADTTFTFDTYGSADTLHENGKQSSAPDPRNTNRLLAPQIAELALTPQLSRVSRFEATRIATNVSTWTTDPAYEVDWAEGDPENPRNWPLWYKAIVIFAISYGTLVVVLYSTSYTTGFEAMQTEFNVKSEIIPTLGVTTYLFGLATGSLLLAPISETYGRRPVYLIAMFFFIIFVIPCATATSLAQIIAVRFFGAVAGSAMIANAPGSVGDIIGDEYRAFAFSVWSIGPLNGPVLGPVIGGFVTQYCGWRWTNWVVLIAAGFAFGLLCFIKETYSPTLLQKKATATRKREGEDRFFSRYDQKLGFVELMKVNLSRPFVMAVKEPICIFWNVYIAILYGILYLCFVAYPIVFTGYRGWTISMSGLAFVGIGIGSMSIIVLEPLIRRMINSHKPDPETGDPPPEAMMSIVCIAACLTPIGQLWFAWTCVPKTIHWAVPIAAGIPFGAGNTAVFIYASNYLVHSYGIYAASAMAGNAVIRSLLGGTLPLAGPALYAKIGANWAGTLLGVLEVLIIPIPFMFYRYGAKIREKSDLIRAMREEEERQNRKRSRYTEKQEKLQNATVVEDSNRSEVVDVEKQDAAQLKYVKGLEKRPDTRLGVDATLKKETEV